MLTLRKLLLRAAAASVRLPVSQLARLPAQLLTKSARSKSEARKSEARSKNFYVIDTISCSLPLASYVFSLVFHL